MGIEIGTLLAIGSAATGAISLVKGIQDRNDANRAARQAQEEETKARSETVAQNAQRQAEERRQQVREERVKRARIVQASENGGVQDSSGEFGAIGALSTNLDNNLGINLGRAASSDRQSSYLQSAADFTGQAQQSARDASFDDKLFDLSANIFGASGGISKAKSIFSDSSTTNWNGVDYQKRGDT